MSQVEKVQLYPGITIQTTSKKAGTKIFNIRMTNVLAEKIFGKLKPSYFSVVFDFYRDTSYRTILIQPKNKSYIPSAGSKDSIEAEYSTYEMQLKINRHPWMYKFSHYPIPVYYEHIEDTGEILIFMNEKYPEHLPYTHSMHGKNSVDFNSIVKYINENQHFAERPSYFQSDHLVKVEEKTNLIVEKKKVAVTTNKSSVKPTINTGLDSMRIPVNNTRKFDSAFLNARATYVHNKIGTDLGFVECTGNTLDFFNYLFQMEKKKKHLSLESFIEWFELDVNNEDYPQQFARTFSRLNNLLNIVGMELIIDGVIRCVIRKNGPLRSTNYQRKAYGKA